MSNFKERLTIEDHKNNFVYKKSNTGLNIQFNRVAFIFFVFFVIYSIYTIHLIHLGSREAKINNTSNYSLLSPSPFNEFLQLIHSLLYIFSFLLN